MQRAKNIMENNRKFGALWKKEKDGRVYMTGEMTVNGKEIKIVCFLREKKSDKEPDFDILTARELKQGLSIEP